MLHAAPLGLGSKKPCGVELLGWEKFIAANCCAGAGSGVVAFGTTSVQHASQ